MKNHLKVRLLGPKQGCHKLLGCAEVLHDRSAGPGAEAGDANAEPGLGALEAMRLREDAPDLKMDANGIKINGKNSRNKAKNRVAISVMLAE